MQKVLQESKRQPGKTSEKITTRQANWSYPTMTAFRANLRCILQCVFQRHRAKPKESSQYHLNFIRQHVCIHQAPQTNRFECCKTPSKWHNLCCWGHFTLLWTVNSPALCCLTTEEQTMHMLRITSSWQSLPHQGSLWLLQERCCYIVILLYTYGADGI